jgi:hypothetical protein
MAEEYFYQPIKDRLGKLFAAKGKPFYLEVTATKGLSEKSVNKKRQALKRLVVVTTGYTEACRRDLRFFNEVLFPVAVVLGQS